MGETIGDYIKTLIPALKTATTDPTRLRSAMIGFDTAMDTFGDHNNRETFNAGVNYWATQVASVSDLAALTKIFNSDWAERAYEILSSEHKDGGLGIVNFQGALKDLGLIDSITVYEIIQSKRTDIPLP